MTDHRRYCAIDFSNFTGVKKEHLVMVGDTMTDVNFAKNSGIAVIGVAKTDKNKSILAPYTDAVISEISDLLDILN